MSMMLLIVAGGWNLRWCCATGGQQWRVSSCHVVLLLVAENIEFSNGAVPLAVVELLDSEATLGWLKDMELPTNLLLVVAARILRWHCY